MNNKKRQSKVGAVLRVSSGNFLEMYDFTIFGYYAASIGQTFSRAVIRRVVSSSNSCPR